MSPTHEVQTKIAVMNSSTRMSKAICAQKKERKFQSEKPPALQSLSWQKTG
jgi:hypothetical protein